MKLRYKITLGLILTLVIIFVVLMFLGIVNWENVVGRDITFPISIVGIGGGSMSPTLHDNDSVVISPLVDPVPGKIIVFTCLVDRCEKRNKFIKRVIGINKENCIWVEGDNRDFSYDSRKYGWLCQNEIFYHGVVIFPFINEIPNEQRETRSLMETSPLLEV